MSRVIVVAFIGLVTILFAVDRTIAQESAKVTATNYVRAESDFQCRTYIENFDCFGSLAHFREPYDVQNQITIRGNRDTLYSFGVFDLNSPLTVTLPNPDGRYQSLMIVSQDHSIASEYGPKKLVLTKDKIGTRYVCLVVRTFMDPNDEADMKAAHRLQDQVVTHQANVGKFEVPAWDKAEVEKMRATINVVAATVDDSSKMFGIKDELDPVYHLLGAALGWGGPVTSHSAYETIFFDGKGKQMIGRNGTYTITTNPPSVNAFWSITVYDTDRGGFFHPNDQDRYQINNTSATKNDDGTVTFTFKQKCEQGDINCLEVPAGRFDYVVRYYLPKEPIRSGKWRMPKAVLQEN